MPGLPLCGNYYSRSRANDILTRLRNPDITHIWCKPVLVKSRLAERWQNISMAIRIKKVSDFLYTADLTLPDMPGITVPRSIPEPMSVDRIIKKLLGRGAHQTDIGDAFYAADPDWLSK
jgi:hypothetical protein